MTSADAPRAEIRTLGLALQLLGVATLGPLLNSFASAVIVMDGDLAGEYLSVTGPLVTAGLAQLVAGWVMSYHSWGPAFLAACAHLVLQIGAVLWLFTRIPVPDGVIMGFCIQLLWPVAVVVAVLRARSAPEEGRRGAEAGGVLVAIGLSQPLSWAIFMVGMLLRVPLGPGDLAPMGGYFGATLVVGVLAARAGSRLISGGRSGLGAYLVAAVLLAVGAFALSTISALGEDGGARFLVYQIVGGGISLAMSLLVPLTIWGYARPSRALAQPGAPDSAAAIGAVSWLVLWDAIQYAGTTATFAVDDSRREAPGWWIGLLLAQVITALGAFVLCRRAPSRAAMWIAGLAGILALGIFVEGSLTSELAGEASRSAGVAGARQAMVLFVLAWLHRPSARAERGVAGVFE